MTEQANNITAQQISDLLGGTLKHAIEAEMSLLGAIMLQPDIMPDVVAKIERDDFFKPSHGFLFEVMADMSAKTGTINVIELQQYLVDRDGAVKYLHPLHGLRYLEDLLNAVPVADDWPRYIELIKAKSLVQKIIGETNRILHDVDANPGKPDEVLERAEDRLYGLHGHDSSLSCEPLDKAIHAVTDSLCGSDGIPTGFPGLDTMTGGLFGSELTVIGARPSMGKTALAINMAVNMAKAGVPVAFFSVEMKTALLLKRIMSSLSGVASSHFRTGEFSTIQHGQVCEAAGTMLDWPLYIVDCPGLNVAQMAMQARRMIRKHDCKVIFVDYIGLMKLGGRVESKRVEVGEISHALKGMAREHDVPVVALSQLNRMSEARQDKRPYLADMKDSGDIEQDADTVMLLYREGYHEPDKYRGQRFEPAELHIAKQRNGATGLHMLSWEAATMTFHEQPGGVI